MASAAQHETHHESEHPLVEEGDKQQHPHALPPEKAQRTWDLTCCGSAPERSSRSMKKAQPHPLTNCKLHWTMAPVIHRLVVLLRLFQTVPNLSQELIMLTHHPVHS
jgi:hypothetical protein